MASKTYIPTLRVLISTLCRYMTRYQVTIRDNLSGTALTAFEAVLVACDALMVALGEPDVNP